MSDGPLRKAFRKKRIRTSCIALEEKNFLWWRKDMWEFEEMYKLGIPLLEIAEYFERDLLKY